MAGEAAFEIRDEDRGPVLALSGDWTVDTVADLEADLRAVAERLTRAVTVDAAGLGRMDMAGAYVLERALRGGGTAEMPEITVREGRANIQRLLETARKAATEPAPKPEGPQGYLGALEQVGRSMGAIGVEIVETMSFLGETLAVLAKLVTRPSRIRWVPIVHAMEVAGLSAMPIVMLLAFFIGLVVAYLGARILGDFGASVFTIELVAFSMMREFAVVITAVLLAGRTDSAFTAEIGAMKMRQEIDAMRVIGIDPMEALVAPRVVAMLVMTPILTFAAMISGLFGGLLVTWGELGVSPVMYIQRISDAVPQQHFWVGMSKAPAFALVLAVIGCKQGLSVGGDVASLGSRVTTSVVQSIFMVILLDAIFALWFLEMDW